MKSTVNLGKNVSNALKLDQLENREWIECSVDALVTLDVLGVITDANRQMCLMTGYRKEELVGTPFIQYFTEPEKAQACIRNVLADDQVKNNDLTLCSKEGNEIPVSYSASTYKSENDTLRGIFAAIRDNTEQKRLEAQILKKNQELTQAMMFLNNVLESATENAIIAQSLDGTILVWNEGACRLYGYTAAEMIGKPNSLILHSPEDIHTGKMRRLLDTAIKTGKGEGLFQGLRKQGEKFIAAVTLTLCQSTEKSPIGYVLIVKDVTEQKRLEQQLEDKNKELKETAQKVQEANRLKSVFLASMSHELRTPLNGIIGFAELMYDEKVGPIAPDHKEFLGDILSCSHHLLNLINDILDLAKVEAGKMEFRPEKIDLKKLLDELGCVLYPLINKKHIDFNTEIDASLSDITIDPAKLKQILYNFISNAVKFTPEKGKITLSVTSENHDQFRIEVKDTGIGIREEDIPKLFTEFQQLDSQDTKKYQGTGLGLALTRKMVRAQGGEVGVQSVFGQGACFWSVLPKVPGIPANKLA